MPDQDNSLLPFIIWEDGKVECHLERSFIFVEYHLRNCAAALTDDAGGTVSPRLTARRHESKIIERQGQLITRSL